MSLTADLSFVRAIVSLAWSPSSERIAIDYVPKGSPSYAVTSHIGVLTLDQTDLLSIAGSQTLTDVVFHEIGHILGVGTLWEGFGCTSDMPVCRDFVENQSGDRPVFTGPAAVRGRPRCQRRWPGERLGPYLPRELPDRRPGAAAALPGLLSRPHARRPARVRGLIRAAGPASGG